MAKEDIKKYEFTSDQDRTKAAEAGRKGGIASGKAKREKKTVQKILNDFMSMPAKNNKKFAAIAKQLGLTDETDIKTVFAVSTMLNSLKNGNLKDTELLTKLIGEQVEITDVEQDKQKEFMDVIMKAVKSDAD